MQNSTSEKRTYPSRFDAFQNKRFQYSFRGSRKLMKKETKTSPPFLRRLQTSVTPPEGLQIYERPLFSPYLTIIHIASTYVKRQIFRITGTTENLVKRFEETGKLEDRARAGRPCLKEARAPCIAVEMEAIASEAALGTSSAREAARRLGLPPSSVRNILRRILQLYPYKLQSVHEFLPAVTAQREAFAKWAFSKME
ncbi:uncharacterized protein TNCV_3324091 [Trichonephila clavipes]|nr:uncharacterized protein TNCV_3324091 [Trichonephila clavipes]